MIESLFGFDNMSVIFQLSIKINEKIHNMKQPNFEINY